MQFGNRSGYYANKTLKLGHSEWTANSSMQLTSYPCTLRLSGSWPCLEKCRKQQYLLTKGEHCAIEASSDIIYGILAFKL
jgi:hypothetical protein